MLEAELNMRSRPESLSSSTSFSMAGARRLCSSAWHASASLSCASLESQSITCKIKQLSVRGTIFLQFIGAELKAQYSTLCGDRQHSVHSCSWHLQ